MLDYDVGTHAIALYFLEFYTVRSKHLLYPYAILVGFRFILQPADRIVLLDALKEIVKIVVAL